MAAQLAEQLFQIRQGNLLPLADGCQRDRAIVLAQGQINHGSDRKTAFGGETHYELLQSGLYVTDRKSTRLNSSHSQISYAVFCLKKKKKEAKLINTIPTAVSLADINRDGES